MTEWIKVEFHAKLPPGLIIEEVKHQEICENLAKVFGFEYITELFVQRVVKEDEPRWGEEEALGNMALGREERKV
jgi:hypothetical protein